MAQSKDQKGIHIIQNINSDRHHRQNYSSNPQEKNQSNETNLHKTSSHHHYSNSKSNPKGERPEDYHYNNHHPYSSFDLDLRQIHSPIDQALLVRSLQNNPIHSHLRSNNDTISPSSSEKEDSPLDFSTKKVKLEDSVTVVGNITPSESPLSRLRNILSMRSPSISEDLDGSGGNATATTLNISKISPNSSVWSKSESRASSNSSPLSPSMETPQHFNPSPRPVNNSVTISLPGGGCGESTLFPTGTNNVTPYPFNFSPWGNGMFSPSLSPVLNQSTTALPLSMEASSQSIFSHNQIATANSGSTGISFHPSLQLSSEGNNGTSASAKGRATRPFKAYPKDPMSFPTVGLFGLPMGPAPGLTEAILREQSNQAYEIFRKRMLPASQSTRTRRSGPKGNNSSGMQSQSDHSNESLNFCGISIENGIHLGDSSKHGMSNSGKMGKSEQQLKDEAYWERRRKNNEAAKRSRDARRNKEDDIAIRAAFLEQENLKLRCELCALLNHNANLRRVL